MTYRQQREPAKSIHIWNKASQEESVVRVVIELESMQECEGLFKTEALKAGSEIILFWRTFLPILMLIPLVSPRYLNSYVTSFNICNQSAHVTAHVTADPLWTEVWLWNMFTPRLLLSFGGTCQICAVMGLAMMMMQAWPTARWRRHKYALPPGAAMLRIIKTVGWEAKLARGGWGEGRATDTRIIRTRCQAGFRAWSRKWSKLTATHEQNALFLIIHIRLFQPDWFWFFFYTQIYMILCFPFIFHSD